MPSCSARVTLAADANASGADCIDSDSGDAPVWRRGAPLAALPVGPDGLSDDRRRASYRGCSPALRRRGEARTRPWAARIGQAPCTRGVAGEAQAAKKPPAIVLELDPGAWAGVACWTGRSERWLLAAAVAYDLRYAVDARPRMGANTIGRASFLKVAAARSAFADFSTGRNCRPTIETLAEVAGVSDRTVQRADTALLLLGLATEVMRGRQRTRRERMASWRVGDRGRGWASVWALHDSPALTSGSSALSPHPVGSHFGEIPSGLSVLTTPSRGPSGSGGRGARRRTDPDRGGSRLAARWRADPASPPWALRHSEHAWGSVLAAPAEAGWSSRDVNTLVADWAGVHGWIPVSPHRPIGLLGAMLRWHGDLTVQPAALDLAREAAELAAARARITQQFEQRERAAIARAGGAAALGGPGHTAARAAAAAAAVRAAERRTDAVAAEIAVRDAAIRAAREGFRAPQVGTIETFP